MYELIQVSDSFYYIQSPAKIGLVKTGENEVCLIDSGNDKDAGKKVLRILEAQGWTLKAIYNTHSHADHIGGNKFLQDRTGCEIYAPEIEKSFTEHTILEPMYLYGGKPPKNLMHKFMMAQESVVQPLNEAALPEGWEIIHLPGHSFNMAGFRTPDNVVYLADCLSSPETLKKYQICFLVDPEKYLETLEMVKVMEAEFFVPAHAEASKDISSLAQMNIDKVYEIADKIVEFCNGPMGFDTLLKKLFEEYELVMNYEQHALLGSTVKSYLTWLTEKGRLKMEIKDNVLIWMNRDER